MYEKYKPFTLSIIFVVIGWIFYILPIPLMSTVLGTLFIFIGVVSFSATKETFDAPTKAVIILFIIIVSGAIHKYSVELYSDAGKNSSTGTVNSENSQLNQKSVPNKVPDNSIILPPDQYAFHDKVEYYRDSYTDAMNDLVKSRLLNKRDDELCSIIGSGSVVGWIGLIERIDATGDGHGYIKVKLPNSFGVMTSNNAFSDSGINTLIKENSPLFEIILNLKNGDKVEYSGKFIKKSHDKCLREISMTNDGSIRYPEFIFKFSEIRKVD